MTSNTFTNDLKKTSINDAYQYNTFSPHVYLQHKYSHICIFCSHNQSKVLMTDGSFRQCSRCNKQFRANII